LKVEIVAFRKKESNIIGGQPLDAVRPQTFVNMEEINQIILALQDNLGINS